MQKLTKSSTYILDFVVFVQTWSLLKTGGSPALTQTVAFGQSPKAEKDSSLKHAG